MDQLTAHKEDYIRNEGVLYVAFELGSKKWKLGFTVGFGQRPRQRAVLAGDLAHRRISCSAKRTSPDRSSFAPIKAWF